MCIPHGASKTPRRALTRGLRQQKARREAGLLNSAMRE
jgi:hypothetical protein